MTTYYTIVPNPPQTLLLDGDHFILVPSVTSDNDVQVEVENCTGYMPVMRWQDRSQSFVPVGPSFFVQGVACGLTWNADLMFFVADSASVTIHGVEWLTVLGSTSVGPGTANLLFMGGGSGAHTCTITAARKGSVLSLHNGRVHGVVVHPVGVTIARAGVGVPGDIALQPGQTLRLVAADDSAFTILGGDVGPKGDPGNDGGFFYTNSATLAIPGGHYALDTRLGSFDLTLPPDPVVNDTVWAYDVGFSCEGSPVTIRRNGSTIDGFDDDLLFDMDAGQIVFAYSGYTWLLNPDTLGSMGPAGPEGPTGPAGPPGAGGGGTPVWQQVVSGDGHLHPVLGERWAWPVGAYDLIVNLPDAGTSPTSDPNDIWVWNTVGGDSGYHFVALTPPAGNNIVVDGVILDEGETVILLAGDMAICYPNGADSWIVRTFMRGREVLSANREYFVSAFGSDSNTGLADDPDNAWLTLQHAIDVVLGTLDFAGNTVTLWVVDNGVTPITYTGNVNVAAAQVGGGYLRIEGMGTSPAMITLHSTIGTTFVADGPTLNIALNNVKLTGAGTGGGLLATRRARVTPEDVEYGNCASGKHLSATFGGLIDITSLYTISGNAQNHMYADWESAINCAVSGAVTLSGSRAFAAGFAKADNLSLIRVPVATYTGTATGNRYDVKGNAKIDVGGRGISIFPGSNPGVASQGGQYDTTMHGFEEVFALEVPTVANQDYTMRYDAPFDGSITKVRCKSQSGTCTVVGKINGVALGGAANSASSSATEQLHTTANTFTKGAVLTFTASGNSACLSLATSFYINRTS